MGLEVFAQGRGYFHAGLDVFVHGDYHRGHALFGGRLIVIVRVRPEDFSRLAITQTNDEIETSDDIRSIHLAKFVKLAGQGIVATTLAADG